MSGPSQDQLQNALFWVLVASTLLGAEALALHMVATLWPPGPPVRRRRGGRR